MPSLSSRLRLLVRRYTRVARRVRARGTHGGFVDGSQWPMTLDPMRGARTNCDNQTENRNEFHEPSFGFASKCAARLCGSPSQDSYQDLPSDSSGRLPFANAPIRRTTHCSHGIESHTASET